MATRITGIEGKTLEEIEREIGEGARFVYYTYAISIIVMTFRRSSNIVFVQPGESAVVKGLPHTLLTLVAGWWGIPWGPIYSIGALFKNLSGGTDVTDDIFEHLSGEARTQAARIAVPPASLDTIAPA